jgi:aspartyl/asparaginyl beta-hydroxylase (cupin superfamily)
MKENQAFLYIEKMSSFDALLNDVLSLTSEDWSKYTDRKSAGGPAAYNTDTIPLVYDTKHRLNSEILHENYEKFKTYIEEILLTTISHIGEVKVQQAMLTKLNANTVIPRHRDVGPLTNKTHRIHVPVITNTQCIFTIENESRNLEAGDIWIIDNVGRYHSVENKGQQDRVHLIIDAI